jgi:hypothetical protein
VVGFFEEELEEMFELDVVTVGFVSVLDFEVFEEEVFVGLHEFGVTVGEGLDKLADGLDGDEVGVGLVGEGFDKGVEMVLVEAGFEEGGLLDFVERVGEVVFDFDGGVFF